MDVLRSGARDNAAQSATTLSAWLPLIVIFAIGVLLRNLVVANTDVSWLITLCEKILNGERPYIDFIETNPPASIYVYMLPVIVARAFSIAPEIVTDSFIFASAAVSLWLSVAIARTANLFDRAVVFQLAALFAAIFLLLPAQTFGEREHIAAIFFLPVLALSAARASGQAVPLWFVLAAGICAGIIAIIKPHFVITIVIVAAAAAWSARNWRVFLALENWIAGAMFAAYGLLVYLAFPVFAEKILPLVAEIYVPIRSPLWKFLIHFGTPICAAIVLLIFLMKGRGVLRAPYSLLFAASLGFSFSYYSQMKGWAYHAYPMLAFALAAAVIAFAKRWPLAAEASEERNERAKRIASAFSIALLAGATFLWMNFAIDMRALRDPIAKAVTNPKVLAITSDIAVGHPLTRALNGTWVGRVCGQWIATGAKILKLEEKNEALRRRYDELEAYDRNMLIEDIRRAKPDIILVDRIRFDWYEWAKSDAGLLRELENYRPLEQINDVLILRRK
jgi:hypothetical protein